MEITKGENANLAGMEPPEGKVRNFDDPETIVDHIVGMVADDGSITDVARELAIDYVRTRLLYAGLERLAYIVEEKLTDPAGMEPRCPKCDSTQVIQVWRLKDGFSVSCYGCGAIFKTPEESHHAQFFRSPAPTPPLDVPSVEEIIKLLGNGWKGFKLGDMEDLMFVVGQIRLAIQKFYSLRRHIASPAQPEKPPKCWKCAANLPHEWQFCEAAPPQSGKENGGNNGTTE